MSLLTKVFFYQIFISVLTFIFITAELKRDFFVNFYKILFVCYGLFFLNNMQCFLFINILIFIYDVNFYKIPNELIIADIIVMCNISSEYSSEYIEQKLLFMLIVFIIFVFFYSKKIGGGDVKFITSSILCLNIEYVHIYFFYIAFFSLILFIILQKRCIPMAPAIVVSKFICCNYNIF